MLCFRLQFTTVHFDNFIDDFGLYPFYFSYCEFESSPTFLGQEMNLETRRLFHLSFLHRFVFTHKKIHIYKF